MAPEDFSLAGPQNPVAVAHQHAPYVDPGYAQLNPAYSQPMYSKPVWSLAKPLPRVVRPGMVPTASEIQANDQSTEQPTITEEDVEKGPEPRLRFNRAVTMKLQQVRAERERRFLEGRMSSQRSRRSRTDSQASDRPSTIQRQGTAIDTLPNVTEEGEWPDDEEESTSEFPAFDPSPAYRPTYEMDDAFSAKTALDAVDDADALTLAHQYPVEDDIYNAHTHWSVWRHRFQQSLAEFLAVMVQLTLGFSADIAVTVGGNPSANAIFASLAWGLATMTGIYIAGGPSGAHLNPMVTIVLYIYRGFPKQQIGNYVAAQFVGAFAAGLVTYGVYQTQINAYIAAADGASTAVHDMANGFVTSLRSSSVTMTAGFFNEFVGTAILAIVVLALGDDTNTPPGAGMTALVLGFVITILVQAFGTNTGAALNPTRDFGPRMALWAVGFKREVLFGDAWWIIGPWCACISGGFVGAALYDICIFTGGESPINYPRKRIWRAGHKSKKKWMRRLHLESKDQQKEESEDDE